MKPLLRKLLAWFLGVSRGFVDILLPALKASAEDLLEDAVLIAAPIVAQLATGTLPGDDKRILAIQRIKAAAQVRGIQLGASVINHAIEIVVAQLTSSKAPVPARQEPPTPPAVPAAIPQAA